MKNNMLSQSIPGGLLRLTNLESIDLANNFLSQYLPGFNRSVPLRNLRRFSVFNNRLTGQNDFEEDDTFKNATTPKLEELNLAKNYLPGRMLSGWGSLTGLKSLSLFENSFEDKIPVSFSALKNLERLFLANNKLAGSLEYAPNERFDGKKWPNLIVLSLSGNQLTGKFEPGVLNRTNFSALEGLFIDDNK